MVSGSIDHAEQANDTSNLVGRKRELTQLSQGTREKFWSCEKIEDLVDLESLRYSYTRRLTKPN